MTVGPAAARDGFVRSSCGETTERLGKRDEFISQVWAYVTLENP